MPWRRITKFANEIAGTIATRFPPEEFLKALDIINGCLDVAAESFKPSYTSIEEIKNQKIIR